MKVSYLVMMVVLASTMKSFGSTGESPESSQETDYKIFTCKPESPILVRIDGQVCRFSQVGYSVEKGVTTPAFLFAEIINGKKDSKCDDIIGRSDRISPVLFKKIVDDLRSTEGLCTKGANWTRYLVDALSLKNSTTDLRFSGKVSNRMPIGSGGDSGLADMSGSGVGMNEYGSGLSGSGLGMNASGIDKRDESRPNLEIGTGHFTFPEQKSPAASTLGR